MRIHLLSRRRLAALRTAAFKLLEAELVVFLLLADLLLHLQHLKVEFLDLAVHLPQLVFQCRGAGCLRDLDLLRLLLLAKDAGQLDRRQMEGKAAVGWLPCATGQGGDA